MFGHTGHRPQGNTECGTLENTKLRQLRMGDDGVHVSTTLLQPYKPPCRRGAIIAAPAAASASDAAAAKICRCDCCFDCCHYKAALIANVFALIITATAAMCACPLLVRSRHLTHVCKTWSQLVTVLCTDIPSINKKHDGCQHGQTASCQAKSTQYDETAFECFASEAPTAAT